jgi:hypothetical protein
MNGGNGVKGENPDKVMRTSATGFIPIRKGEIVDLPSFRSDEGLPPSEALDSTAG